MPEYNFTFDWNRITTIGKVKILAEQVVGSPSQEAINTAVAAYIEDHPGALSPLSAATKAALLQIAEKVAYIDEHGQDYYNALDAALNARALLQITAVYTQSGTVYDTDSLESLEADLVVTAYYDDGTSAVIASGYTLSGELTVGTSTVTVTYSEKTATFDVTVTAAPTYITDGLVHRWDGIDNTGAGHDNSVTVWKDLVGNIDLTKQAGGTWTENALHFEPTAGTDTYYWKDLTETSVYSQNMTIEVCITPTASATVAEWSDNKSAVIANISSSGSNQLRRIMLSKGDISVGGYTNGTTQFATTGLTSLLEIRHIACTFTQQTGTNTIYSNGVQKTLNANHTFGEYQKDYVFVGCSLGNSKYPYLGDIHSVRVYNRVLTAEEVAQNYAADVIRFGLE